MAITAGGVGSGLDVNGIVTQLMALESRPVNLLEAKGREYESQLSAYGRLRSAMSTFQSAMEGLGSIDKFKAFSADSSDEDILTATTTSDAAKGTYDIDISRLAQRHKMASDPSLNTDTFTGDLTITVGSDSLTINPAGKTLGEIRDLINSDETNPGVTASIINVGSGNQRLILSAEEEGYESRLQLGGSLATSLNLSTTNQVPETNFFGQTEYVDITDLADLDASFTVDGFSITSSSNQASSVIDGITFELKDVGESRLTLDRDDQKIKDSVQEFVDAYNALHSTLDSLSKNELAGDSSVRSIQSQIRNVFNTAPIGLDGSFQALVSVGIDSDARTGTLSLDASSLENALSIDFQSVADLFAHDEQGFSSRLADVADNMLDDANIVDAREEGLRSRIREVENDIFSWEARLELKERALRAQFASLDALIGSLQSTSAFLAQNLVQQQ